MLPLHPADVAERLAQQAADAAGSGVAANAGEHRRTGTSSSSSSGQSSEDDSSGEPSEGHNSSDSSEEESSEPEDTDTEDDYADEEEDGSDDEDDAPAMEGASNATNAGLKCAFNILSYWDPNLHVGYDFMHSMGGVLKVSCY
jgi:hypothetical protein